MGKKIDDATISSGAPALRTDKIPIGRSGNSALNLLLSDLFVPLGVEDTLTAHAGGGQGSALALSALAAIHRITTCATAGDSVKLPTSIANNYHYIRNDGAAACQVYGAGTDTINGIATATGVSLPNNAGAWFVCHVAGAWTSTPLVDYMRVVLTNGATFTGGCTMPGLVVSAASAIVQQSVSGANTFAGSAAFSSAVTVSGTLHTSGAIDGVSATLSSRLNANSVQASAIVHTANIASAMTLAGAHAGMQIDHSHSAGVILTIPPNTGQFATGCIVFNTQQSAGKITFSAGSGVTVANVNSQTKSQGQNSVTFCQLTDVADRWNLVGATGP